VSDDAFTTIKKLLVPYAKHFTVFSDTDDTYDLEEELPHSRTMFGYVHRSRGGARLIFYPLNAFPELRAGLPQVLASKLKSKYVLPFSTITAGQRAALAKLFQVAWARIAAQRELNPKRAYYRKLDLDETQAAIEKLVAGGAREGVTVERRTNDLAITLPSRLKVPAVLAAKQKKPGTLRLKTITPAEYDALAKLVRASGR
jgi:hypothetical protein